MKIEWIPIYNYVLPEKDGFYLVTAVDEKGKRHVTESYFSVVRQEWSWPEKILAWAYMPEPYDGI